MSVKLLRRLLAKPRTSVYLGDNEALTKTMFGHKMIVDTRDLSLAAHLLMDHYWELWVTKAIMNILKKSMNIIEVGANFGYYSILMADKIGDNGKIFAFEANSRIIGLLNDNILMNGFDDRVKVENNAVTDKIGEIVLNISPKLYAWSSIVQRDIPTEQLRIKSLSLDTYFENFKAPIDFVKIDAEGSEPLIFNGMRKLIARNPDIQIVCEFNKPLLSAHEEP